VLIANDDGTEVMSGQKNYWGCGYCSYRTQCAESMKEHPPIPVNIEVALK
jgi:hypothetical protein